MRSKADIIKLSALQKKLNKAQDVTTAETIAAVKQAQRDIAAEVAYMSRKASIMKNVKERDKLYSAINSRFGKLQKDLDKRLTSLVEKTATDTHKSAVLDMQNKRAVKGIVQYSPERTARYLAMVRNETSGNMAAVFTDKMSNEAIRALRSAWVSTYRTAAVTGLTANETHRLLQNSWDKLAGNMDAFRFVDKGGRSWSNARYLQMLVRTNSQRVARDSYVDTMVDAGFSLARISDDGDEDCPICAAWEGRIIQVAGPSKKWPTLDDAYAAGMFHPNCRHKPEYIDETLDVDEIALQSKIKKPPEGVTTEQMQTEKNQIDEGRYEAKGLSKTAARIAVTRDRLARNILTGTFNESAVKAVDKLSDKQVLDINKAGIPHFEQKKRGDTVGWNKGSKGGMVIIPKDAGPGDVIKALGVEDE